MNTLNNIMKSIDLLLDNENLLNLQSFLIFTNQQTTGTEFEIRFQNLAQYQFEQIKNYIEIDKYFNTKKETKSVSILLPNGVRIEKFGEPNTKEYREVFQNKRELKSMKLFINDISIKFNLSRENRIEPKTIKEKTPILTRIKYRTSYIFEQYYIDLTYVESIDDKNVKSYSFEAEIEFKTNKNINEQNVVIPIKYILKLLKPNRFSFMDSLTEQSIRKDYLSFISFSNNTRPDYIYENKPINFKLENVSTFNHSITNKLNGINFFLLFDSIKNSFYLINHSTVEYIGKDTTNELKGRFLIQGELYHDINSNKYIFYIFDTIIINSNKTINDFHKIRLDKFFPYFSIIDKSLFYTNKQISLQYKTFYGINGIDHNNPNDNYYNNLIQCLYSLSKDKNGNVDMEINDGFIFTPLDKPYINKETYKYKFPETMTIDFSVVYKETKNNSYIYKIYTYNERKQLVPFMFNKYIMKCDNEQLCKQIKNNSIVECFFNKNEQIFIPYRIRHDKILPNFYKVADSVFSDIINPITLKDLEDSFKNKFLKYSQPKSKSSQLSIKPLVLPSTDVLDIVQPKSKSPQSESVKIPRRKTQIVKNVTIDESNKLILKEPDIPEENIEDLKYIPMSPPYKSPIQMIPSPSSMVRNYYSPSFEQEEEQENILNNVFKEYPPRTPEGTPPRIIEIKNIDYKVKLDTLFECVFFSVSPEYRELSKSDNKRDTMFQIALEYFNNNNEKIKDIDYLAKSFNVDIYMLKFMNENKYKIIDRTENSNENKLYIEYTDIFKVLGYKDNGYDIFIY